VLVGCGAQERTSGEGSRISRYGISIGIPEGWHGEITRGAVRLGTVPAGTKLGEDDLSVVLFEYELAPPESEASVAQNYDGNWPARFGAKDFTNPDTQGSIDEANAPGRRAVAVGGRFFNVFPESGSRTVSETHIEELNEALAGIQVEPGDFYRGQASALAFPERRGWHVITSGDGRRYAQGEYVYLAAATIPYRNDFNDLPPARTLEALPRDGILLWVSLSRDGRSPPWTWDGGGAFEPRRLPPYRIRDLERRYPWKGQVRDIPEYLLWAANSDQYLVDLRVYFGRLHPTEAMLAEADAVLRALEFPDWGPWELDQAEGA
jgi:hypothetical protein